MVPMVDTVLWLFSYMEQKTDAITLLGRQNSKLFSQLQLVILDETYCIFADSCLGCCQWPSCLMCHVENHRLAD